MMFWAISSAWFELLEPQPCENRRQYGHHHGQLAHLHPPGLFERY